MYQLVPIILHRIILKKGVIGNDERSKKDEVSEITVKGRKQDL